MHKSITVIVISKYKYASVTKLIKLGKNNLLSELLERTGPCLSSKLASFLCSELEIQPATARKRIERAKLAGEIFAVEGIKFRHNEQFLYTKGQEKSAQLQRALFDALVESSSAYRLPLLGIASRGGIVPDYLYPVISGFPLSARERRQDCYAALAYLINARLLSRGPDQCIEISPTFAPNKLSIVRLHSRLLAEKLLILALRDWCRLQGLSSTEHVSVRSAGNHPQFGFYQWDFVAPSYITPISTFANDQVNVGFLVADVVLGRKLSLADVTPYLKKVFSARANSKNRPFLAILLADWFDKEALLEGRKNGLLFTTPKNFFGKPFAEILDDLIQSFEHKESFFSAEPDYLRKIVANLTSIAHLQEAVNQANRAVFQLLVGYCYSSACGEPARYDVVFSSKFASDVCVQNEHGLSICDLNWKLEKDAISKEDVQKWLEKILLFNKSETAIPLQPQFVLCTNRVFSSDALSLLQSTATNLPISWLDAPTLRSFVASKDNTLNNLLNSSILD